MKKSAARKWQTTAREISCASGAGTSDALHSLPTHVIWCVRDDKKNVIEQRSAANTSTTTRMKCRNFKPHGRWNVAHTCFQLMDYIGANTPSNYRILCDPRSDGDVGRCSHGRRVEIFIMPAQSLFVQSSNSHSCRRRTSCDCSCTALCSGEIDSLIWWTLFFVQIFLLL